MYINLNGKDMTELDEEIREINENNTETENIEDNEEENKNESETTDEQPNDTEEEWEYANESTDWEWERLIKEDGQAVDKAAKKVIAKTDIVATVSYLLGQKEEIIEKYYGERGSKCLQELKENDAANIIRYLCKLRTALNNNFLKTNYMREQLVSIDRMEWFDANEIRQLRKLGVDVILPNKMANDYAMFFNEKIDQYIDGVKDLFPQWLNYEYIRDVFVIPGYWKGVALKQEYGKYWRSRNFYPYRMYLHWEPVEMGNILSSDAKFVRILYSQHGEEFTDRSKCFDAAEETKKSIYDFINGAGSVVICVDCENSSPYKLYGALCNLDPSQLDKIQKIVLYDDSHTTRGWDYLKTLTTIDIEHIMVDRIVDGKSLVDIRMSAGICKAHYEKNIDSFIICSSDSDFWGLIQTLDKANFLVMYEYTKCGQAIKEALDERKIFHCSLDDFFTGNAQKLQTVVLKKGLSERALYLVGKDAWVLTQELFASERIQASEGDMRLFYEKYVKTLRLKLDENGVFQIVVAD